MLMYTCLVEGSIHEQTARQNTMPKVENAKPQRALAGAFFGPAESRGFGLWQSLAYVSGNHELAGTSPFP